MKRRDLIVTQKGYSVKYGYEDKIGKLTVLRYLGKLRNGPKNNKYEPYYETQCDCGNYRDVSQAYLRNKGRNQQCKDCGTQAHAWNLGLQMKSRKVPERILKIARGAWV